MTLLTTVQNAAEALGIKPPASVADSTSDTARALKRFAVNTAEELMREHDWQVLTKEHEITITGPKDAYELPDDLDRIIPNSFWNENDRWRVRGNQTAEEWARRKNSWDFSSSFNAAFFISQGLITFDPKPDGLDIVSFYYISKNFLDDNSSTWNADSQSSLIPEQLIEYGVIYKMLRRLGRDYAGELNDYTAQKYRYFGQDVPAPVINLGPNAVQFAGITPETGIG